jgi:hypothetical protein
MPVVWRSMFNAETMIQVHDTSTCMSTWMLTFNHPPALCNPTNPHPMNSQQ